MKSPCSFTSRQQIRKFRIGPDKRLDKILVSTNTRLFIVQQEKDKNDEKNIRRNISA